MKSISSWCMKLTLVLAVILCGAIVAADERISTNTKKRSLQHASNKPTRPPTKKPTKVSTANHPTRPPTTPPTKAPRDGSGAIAAPTQHPTTPSPSTRPPTYYYTRPKATSSPSSTSAARSGSADTQLAGAANQYSTRAPSKERLSVLSTQKPATTPAKQPTPASGRNPHWWRTYRAKYGQRWKKCAYLKQRTATQGGRCRTLKTGPYFCARGRQYACGQDGVWEYEYPAERCNCSDGTFDCSPIELLPADVDCSAVSQ